MSKTVEGIIPVMITPFTDDGTIDYPGLERLIEWYLGHGVDALFAVCQSSEMQFLSLEERGELGRFVVRQVAGRVPVVVSGHISDAIDDQVASSPSRPRPGRTPSCWSPTISIPSGWARSCSGTRWKRC